MTNQWKPIYRKDNTKINSYIKANEKIIVTYDTIGLLTETNEVKFYKRDGVIYFDLSKAMDDKFHKDNDKMIVR